MSGFNLSTWHSTNGLCQTKGTCKALHFINQLLFWLMEGTFTMRLTVFWMGKPSFFVVERPSNHSTFSRHSIGAYMYIRLRGTNRFFIRCKRGNNLKATHNKGKLDKWTALWLSWGLFTYFPIACFLKDSLKGTLLCWALLLLKVNFKCLFRELGTNQLTFQGGLL